MTKKILKPERNCICSWAFLCVWEDKKNIFKEILIPKPVTEGTGRKNPTGVNADTIACTHSLHKITFTIRSRDLAWLIPGKNQTPDLYRNTSKYLYWTQYHMQIKVSFQLCVCRRKPVSTAKAWVLKSEKENYYKTSKAPCLHCVLKVILVF